MIRSLHRLFRVLALAATVGLAATSALALDSGWPRTLPVDDGMVTIYAPQVDGLDGDVLRYRAALAWRPSADAEPIFGAGWFESRVNIDRGQRIVQPLDLRLTDTRFPAGTADLQPGQVLDELEVLSHCTTENTIVAETSGTRVLAVPVDCFDTTLEHDQDFARRVLALETRQLQRVTRHSAIFPA